MQLLEPLMHLFGKRTPKPVQNEEHDAVLQKLLEQEARLRILDLQATQVSRRK